MMVLFEDGEPQASAVGALPKGALERALGLGDDEEELELRTVGGRAAAQAVAASSR